MGIFAYILNAKTKKEEEFWALSHSNMKFLFSKSTNTDTTSSGYGFGTFQGVFTPSILTIIGVVMYLRFGWMLGHVGLTTSLFIVTIGSTITFLTGLSISALATNMRMKGGGAYFILSRSLGLETGAAIGLPLAISQAIGVSFYVAGFAEALVNSGLPVVSTWDMRIVGLITLTALALLSTLSADLALKSQYFIMAAIFASLVSFFLGKTPENLASLTPQVPPTPIGFWPVFAVFFPAVTGILSGVGMSGDLKNPSKSIPIGTIASVLVGYIIYMSVPIALKHFVSDPAILMTDTMILAKCARFPALILIGVWAATLSSAVGSFLCAPRVLQALSRDRLIPSFFGTGFGTTDDPRISAGCCFALAGICIWLGDINIIAPMLTLFNLSTYGLLNLSAGLEEALSNPSWRPTFRVKSWLSLIGFVGCIAAMFMISPGWTFVVIICEGAIYAYTKHKALRAQWGDMRTGLLMAMARYVSMRLSQDKNHQERNWRPNFLVLTHLPISGKRSLQIVRDVAGGRSFVTIASILPEEITEALQIDGLRDAILRESDKIELNAMIKLVSNNDVWAGLSSLVKNYGFGPFTPNTIVLGHPEKQHLTQYAMLIRQLSLSQRNILIIDNDNDSIIPHGTIDIWWRGKHSNGTFMLAIAFLLERTDFWRKFTLRVNMIVANRETERADEQLAEFLANARITAETRITESTEHFTKVIEENSSDAALTFIGLRRPSSNETDSAYGSYLHSLKSSLHKVPFPIFVLANENVDFHRIFS